MHVIPVYTHCTTLQRLAESRPAELDAWLHPGELEEYAQLKDRRRQDQWLAGRWLSKQIIRHAEHGPVPDLRSLWIRSRDQAGSGIRPQVLLQDEPQPWSLSIAHSDVVALASLALSRKISLGVDLVERRLLSAGLMHAWFTDTEQAWLRQGDPFEAATVWALKEAIYKALQRGEGFAPRQIEVRRLDGHRYAGTFHGRPLENVCRLHSWEQDGHVAALAIGCESARTTGRLVRLAESPELNTVG